MTQLRTQPITISMLFISLWSLIKLGNDRRCELYLETTTKIYLLCIFIILHANHSYSSAVPSISYDDYDPAEHKRIFFTHVTAYVALILRIKIGIPFAYKQQFISANLEIFYQ